MSETIRMAHFGDPCIHCGVSFEDMAFGSCNGDPSKVKIIRFGVVRQAWQNPVTQCDDIIVLKSDGWTYHESHHPSSHWRYSERFRDAECVGRDAILTTDAACVARRSSKPLQVEAAQ